MLVMPAILETYTSLKDRSLKLIFYGNEPSPDQLVSIATSIQKAGFLAFQSDAFKTEQLEALKNIKADYVETGKTQSQRTELYAVADYEATHCQPIINFNTRTNDTRNTKPAIDI